MKLVNFDDGNGVRAGVVIEHRIRGLSELPGFSSVRSVDELLASGHLEELRRAVGFLPPKGGSSIESSRLLSPILLPEKILCAAVNYGGHGKEKGSSPPKEPYFFTKFRNCIIGNGDPILIPRVSSKADWEVELAVIIGKRGKYIRREDAMDYIAGYAIANDVSFRDRQFPEGWPSKLNAQGQNWVMGKALDSAFPLGPWLVTRDEIANPQNIRISLSVNGAVRQDSTTGDMIFGVDRLVEYLSSGITLSPGDVISTGTPAGVAAYSGAPFLKDGDVVECQIEGIGKLRNPVVQET
ncbi:MAG: fumarylacetoacetate hydrolase family protein [Nitrososphaerales archaeon]|nr:fumarylacetoacetate hydrolase family protein [Nitrososphaerales archaeon]